MQMKCDKAAGDHSYVSPAATGRPLSLPLPFSLIRDRQLYSTVWLSLFKLNKDNPGGYGLAATAAASASELAFIESVRALSFAGSVPASMICCRSVVISTTADASTPLVEVT